MAIVIGIDGCMGVGKSTVGQLLSKVLNAPYFEERYRENDYIQKNLRG